MTASFHGEIDAVLTCPEQGFRYILCIFSEDDETLLSMSGNVVEEDIRGVRTAGFSADSAQRLRLSA